MHELVVVLRGADAVPPDPVRPPGLVDRGVVEVAAVGAPGHAAQDPLDHVGQQLAVGQVLDPHPVALVAVGVGGVGEEAVVEADRRGAHREELVPLGEDVEVEQDLLAGERRLVHRAVLRRLGWGPVVAVGADPAGRAVLLALEGARVVPVAALAGGDRQVGLLGARLDLVEDHLPQVGQVGGPVVGPGVLGLEVAAHLGVVLRAQPLVVVGPLAAVVGRGDRATWRDGRLGEVGLVGHGVTLAGGVKVADVWTNPPQDRRHPVEQPGVSVESGVDRVEGREMSSSFLRNPCASCARTRRTLLPIPLAGSGSGGGARIHPASCSCVGPVTGTAGSAPAFGGSGVTSPVKPRGS